MKTLDVVMLQDGRTATILEIFTNSCLVEVGSSPKDWEIISVKKTDIESILKPL